MSPHERKTGRRWSETFREIGALSTVGFSFVLAIVIGAGTGLLLDHWFGTTKVFFLIFFVFGVVAGIINVYRAAGRFLK